MYRRRGGLNARAAHKVQAPQGGQGGGMPAPPGPQLQPQDGTLQSQQVSFFIVCSILVTFTHYLKTGILGLLLVEERNVALILSLYFSPNLIHPPANSPVFSSY